VTQPVLVQWTVSVSHVNAFFQEAAGEKASGGVVAGRGEYFVVRFPPDVRTVAQAMVRLKCELLIGQHAEWRDNVLFKILVLVIAPDQDEVRLEGINLLTDFPKGFEHPRPVGFV
jgi:hypothetical protein